mmetsp:Transcript_10036/g.19631  ORF Transcript_10036/g.19631 Transcript_10036/m.19631 type:complete len:388 (+) Transcript_10036:166-1329(+)|eukprot:CAMPEP_0173390974 /NCGR_PEP_ID=MMETSP1356-20130122/16780_1 /TAXON_ID=77927 ORGANISM="Hemiselmis virescens, Strain PCC157" /NCGR_SAMPLE_ID=MMETSP1356 /ASSEMBLY_ACC=CAM_ASM_000847 /LENGTH=387 /DNA_ID=CAMNT_0014348477 /DNA_START=146 /DNA_END=1309 /DNA_ORIENTATION=+
MSIPLMEHPSVPGKEGGGMAHSSSFSDFSDSEKGAGMFMRACSDTRLGETFVRDRLTSDPFAGFQGSPLATMNSLPPQSKFDPNTGKFYRSLSVDAAKVPTSVSAHELLSLFSGDDQLSYSNETHTGTVVSLAGLAFTFTCVGETHVDCNNMYTEVQARMEDLLIGGSDDQEVECAMGMSLFPGNKQVVTEKDVELVADSCAGMSLFAPANPSKTARPVAADSCGGMTMFSWEDEEEVLSGHTTEDEEAGESSPSAFATLSKVILNTCAGMTLFGLAKEQPAEDNITATESAFGLTLFKSDRPAFANSFQAESCCGMTTFSERLADESYDGEESEEEEYEYDLPCDVAADSVCGWTDFGPALRAIQNKPETYTAEQQWMSDLAFGVH